MIVLLTVEVLAVAYGTGYALWGCRTRDSWEQVDRNLRAVGINVACAGVNVLLFYLGAVFSVNYTFASTDRATLGTRR